MKNNSSNINNSNGNNSNVYNNTNTASGRRHVPERVLQGRRKEFSDTALKQHQHDQMATAAYEKMMMANSGGVGSGVNTGNQFQQTYPPQPLHSNNDAKKTLNHLNNTSSSSAVPTPIRMTGMRAPHNPILPFASSSTLDKIATATNTNVSSYIANSNNGKSNQNGMNTSSSPAFSSSSLSSPLPPQHNINNTSDVLNTYQHTSLHGVHHSINNSGNKNVKGSVGNKKGFNHTANNGGAEEDENIRNLVTFALDGDASDTTMTPVTIPPSSTDADDGSKSAVVGSGSNSTLKLPPIYQQALSGQPPRRSISNSHGSVGGGGSRPAANALDIELNSRVDPTLVTRIGMRLPMMERVMIDKASSKNNNGNDNDNYDDGGDDTISASASAAKKNKKAVNFDKLTPSSAAAYNVSETIAALLTPGGSIKTTESLLDKYRQQRLREELEMTNEGKDTLDINEVVSDMKMGLTRVKKMVEVMDEDELDVGGGSALYANKSGGIRGGAGVYRDGTYYQEMLKTSHNKEYYEKDRTTGYGGKESTVEVLQSALQVMMREVQGQNDQLNKMKLSESTLTKRVIDLQSMVKSANDESDELRVALSQQQQKVMAMAQRLGGGAANGGGGGTHSTADGGSMSDPHHDSFDGGFGRTATSHWDQEPLMASAGGGNISGGAASSATAAAPLLDADIEQIHPKTAQRQLSSRATACAFPLLASPSAFAATISDTAPIINGGGGRNQNKNNSSNGNSGNGTQMSHNNGPGGGTAATATTVLTLNQLISIPLDPNAVGGSTDFGGGGGGSSSGHHHHHNSNSVNSKLNTIITNSFSAQLMNTAAQLLSEASMGGTADRGTSAAIPRVLPSILAHSSASAFSTLAPPICGGGSGAGGGNSSSSSSSSSSSGTTLQSLTVRSLPRSMHAMLVGHQQLLEELQRRIHRGSGGLNFSSENGGAASSNKQTTAQSATNSGAAGGSGGNNLSNATSTLISVNGSQNRLAFSVNTLSSVSSASSGGGGMNSANGSHGVFLGGITGDEVGVMAPSVYFGCVAMAVAIDACPRDTVQPINNNNSNKKTTSAAAGGGANAAAKRGSISSRPTPIIPSLGMVEDILMAERKNTQKQQNGAPPLQSSSSSLSSSSSSSTIPSTGVKEQVIVTYLEELWGRDMKHHPLLSASFGGGESGTTTTQPQQRTPSAAAASAPSPSSSLPNTNASSSQLQNTATNTARRLQIATLSGSTFSNNTDTTVMSNSSDGGGGAHNSSNKSTSSSSAASSLPPPTSFVVGALGCIPQPLSEPPTILSTTLEVNTNNTVATIAGKKKGRKNSQSKGDENNSSADVANSSVGIKNSELHPQPNDALDYKLLLAQTIANSCESLHSSIAPRTAAVLTNVTLVAFSVEDFATGIRKELEHNSTFTNDLERFLVIFWSSVRRLVSQFGGCLLYEDLRRDLYLNCEGVAVFTTIAAAIGFSNRLHQVLMWPSMDKENPYATTNSSKNNNNKRSSKRSPSKNDGRQRKNSSNNRRESSFQNYNSPSSNVAYSQAAMKSAASQQYTFGTAATANANNAASLSTTTVAPNSNGNNATNETSSSSASEKRSVSGGSGFDSTGAPLFTVKEMLQGTSENGDYAHWPFVIDRLISSQKIHDGNYYEKESKESALNNSSTNAADIEGGGESDDPASIVWCGPRMKVGISRGQLFLHEGLPTFTQRSTKNYSLEIANANVNGTNGNGASASAMPANEAAMAVTQEDLLQRQNLNALDAEEKFCRENTEIIVSASGGGVMNASASSSYHLEKNILGGIAHQTAIAELSSLVTATTTTTSGGGSSSPRHHEKNNTTSTASPSAAKDPLSASQSPRSMNASSQPPPPSWPHHHPDLLPQHPAAYLQHTLHVPLSTIEPIDETSVENVVAHSEFSGATLDLAVLLSQHCAGGLTAMATDVKQFFEMAQRHLENHHHVTFDDASRCADLFTNHTKIEIHLLQKLLLSDVYGGGSNKHKGSHSNNKMDFTSSFFSTCVTAPTTSQEISSDSSKNENSKGSSSSNVILGAAMGGGLIDQGVINVVVGGDRDAIIKRAIRQQKKDAASAKKRRAAAKARRKQRRKEKAEDDEDEFDDEDEDNDHRSDDEDDDDYSSDDNDASSSSGDVSDPNPQTQNTPATSTFSNASTLEWLMKQSSLQETSMVMVIDDNKKHSSSSSIMTSPISSHGPFASSLNPLGRAASVYGAVVRDRLERFESFVVHDVVTKACGGGGVSHSQRHHNQHASAPSTSTKKNNGESSSAAGKSQGKSGAALAEAPNGLNNDTPAAVTSEAVSSPTGPSSATLPSTAMTSPRNISSSPAMITSTAASTAMLVAAVNSNVLSVVDKSVRYTKHCAIADHVLLNCGGDDVSGFGTSNKNKSSTVTSPANVSSSSSALITPSSRAQLASVTIPIHYYCFASPFTPPASYEARLRLAKETSSLRIVNAQLRQQDQKALMAEDERMRRNGGCGGNVADSSWMMAQRRQSNRRRKTVNPEDDEDNTNERSGIYERPTSGKRNSRGVFAMTIVSPSSSKKTSLTHGINLFVANRPRLPYVVRGWICESSPSAQGVLDEVGAQPLSSFASGLAKMSSFTSASPNATAASTIQRKINLQRQRMTQHDRKKNKNKFSEANNNNPVETGSSANNNLSSCAQDTSSSSSASLYTICIRMSQPLPSELAFPSEIRQRLFSASYGHNKKAQQTLAATTNQSKQQILVMRQLSKQQQNQQSSSKNASSMIVNKRLLLAMLRDRITAANNNSSHAPSSSAYIHPLISAHQLLRSTVSPLPLIANPLHSSHLIFASVYNNISPCYSRPKGCFYPFLDDISMLEDEFEENNLRRLKEFDRLTKSLDHLRIGGMFGGSGSKVGRRGGRKASNDDGTGDPSSSRSKLVVSSSSSKTKNRHATNSNCLPTVAATTTTTGGGGSAPSSGVNDDCDMWMQKLTSLPNTQHFTAIARAVSNAAIGSTFLKCFQTVEEEIGREEERMRQLKMRVEEKRRIREAKLIQKRRRHGFADDDENATFSSSSASSDDDDDDDRGSDEDEEDDEELYFTAKRRLLKLQRRQKKLYLRALRKSISDNSEVLCLSGSNEWSRVIENTNQKSVEVVKECWKQSNVAIRLLHAVKHEEDEEEELLIASEEKGKFGNGTASSSAAVSNPTYYGMAPTSTARDEDNDADSYHLGSDFSLSDSSVSSSGEDDDDEDENSWDQFGSGGGRRRSKNDSSSFEGQRRRSSNLSRDEKKRLRDQNLRAKRNSSILGLDRNENYRNSGNGGGGAGTSSSVGQQLQATRQSIFATGTRTSAAGKLLLRQSATGSGIDFNGGKQRRGGGGHSSILSATGGGGGGGGGGLLGGGSAYDLTDADADPLSDEKLHELAIEKLKTQILLSRVHSLVGDVLSITTTTNSSSTSSNNENGSSSFAVTRRLKPSEAIAAASMNVLYNILDFEYHDIADDDDDGAEGDDDDDNPLSRGTDDDGPTEDSKKKLQVRQPSLNLDNLDHMYASDSPLLFTPNRHANRREKNKFTSNNPIGSSNSDTNANGGLPQNSSSSAGGNPSSNAAAAASSSSTSGSMLPSHAAHHIVIADSDAEWLTLGSRNPHFITALLKELELMNKRANGKNKIEFYTTTMAPTATSSSASAGRGGASSASSASQAQSASPLRAPKIKSNYAEADEKVYSKIKNYFTSYNSSDDEDDDDNEDNDAAAAMMGSSTTNSNYYYTGGGGGGGSSSSTLAEFSHYFNTYDSETGDEEEQMCKTVGPEDYDKLAMWKCYKRFLFSSASTLGKKKNNNGTVGGGGTSKFASPSSSPRGTDDQQQQFGLKRGKQQLMNMLRAVYGSGYKPTPSVDSTVTGDSSTAALDYNDFLQPLLCHAAVSVLPLPKALHLPSVLNTFYGNGNYCSVHSSSTHPPLPSTLPFSSYHPETHYGSDDEENDQNDSGDDGSGSGGGGGGGGGHSTFGGSSAVSGGSGYALIGGGRGASSFANGADDNSSQPFFRAPSSHFLSGGRKSAASFGASPSSVNSSLAHSTIPADRFGAFSSFASPRHIITNSSELLNSGGGGGSSVSRQLVGGAHSLYVQWRQLAAEGSLSLSSASAVGKALSVEENKSAIGSNKAASAGGAAGDGNKYTSPTAMLMAERDRVLIAKHHKKLCRWLSDRLVVCGLISASASSASSLISQVAYLNRQYAFDLAHRSNLRRQEAVAELQHQLLSGSSGSGPKGVVTKFPPKPVIGGGGGIIRPTSSASAAASTNAVLASIRLPFNFPVDLNELDCLREVIQTSQFYVDYSGYQEEDDESDDEKTGASKKKSIATKTSAEQSSKTANASSNGHNATNPLHVSPITASFAVNAYDLEENFEEALLGTIVSDGNRVKSTADSSSAAKQKSNSLISFRPIESSSLTKNRKTDNVTSTSGTLSEVLLALFRSRGDTLASSSHHSRADNSMGHGSDNNSNGEILLSSHGADPSPVMATGMWIPSFAEAALHFLATLKQNEKDGKCEKLLNGFGGGGGRNRNGGNASSAGSGSLKASKSSSASYHHSSVLAFVRYLCEDSLSLRHAMGKLNRVVMASVQLNSKPKTTPIVSPPASGNNHQQHADPTAAAKNLAMIVLASALSSPSSSISRGLSSSSSAVRRLQHHSGQQDKDEESMQREASQNALFAFDMEKNGCDDWWQRVHFNKMVSDDAR